MCRYIVFAIIMLLSFAYLQDFAADVVRITSYHSRGALMKLFDLRNKLDKESINSIYNTVSQALYSWTKEIFANVEERDYHK